MWLSHMEETDVKIMHGRNGREYGLPELRRFSVDGYCPRHAQSTSYFVASITATCVSRSVSSQT